MLPYQCANCMCLCFIGVVSSRNSFNPIIIVLYGADGQYSLATNVQPIFSYSLSGIHRVLLRSTYTLNPAAINFCTSLGTHITRSSPSFTS